MSSAFSGGSTYSNRGFNKSGNPKHRAQMFGKTENVHSGSWNNTVGL